MKNHFLKFLIFICLFLISAIDLFAQKEKDWKKENEKETDKPGNHYTYSSGSVRYNPKTGKYESVEGEWKKQPEETQYDPKKWGKPKFKRHVYGKNPLRRLFKIKPKSPKPEANPDNPEKEKPFTTGEEKKDKEK